MNNATLVAAGCAAALAVLSTLRIGRRRSTTGVSRATRLRSRTLIVTPLAIEGLTGRSRRQPVHDRPRGDRDAVPGVADQYCESLAGRGGHHPERRGLQPVRDRVRRARQPLCRRRLRSRAGLDAEAGRGDTAARDRLRHRRPGHQRPRFRPRRQPLDRGRHHGAGTSLEDHVFRKRRRSVPHPADAQRRRPRRRHCRSRRRAREPHRAARATRRTSSPTGWRSTTTAISTSPTRRAARSGRRDSTAAEI